MTKSEILKSHMLNTIENATCEAIKRQLEQHLDNYRKYPVTFQHPAHWQSDDDRVTDDVFNDEKVIQAFTDYVRAISEKQEKGVKLQVRSEYLAERDRKETERSMTGSDI